MLKASVIIPNYNHASFLKDRIDSVVNQTFQDFELIILDDCSPDNSREIIELYRNHPRVSHIVYNEVNGGTTFKQWEKGISLAKGKYIWIAESDDWCEPTLLNTLINGLEEDESCTLAYVQSSIVKNDGAIIFQSSRRHLSEYMEGIEFIKSCMLSGNAVFNASMAIFRKDVYYKFSREFTQFRFCGDWLFWIEIAKRGNVFISGKVLNYFRKHEKDVSGKAYATGINFAEEIRILEAVKTDHIINEEEYKKALLTKYCSYRIVKQSFVAETRASIEKIFYTGKNSYKGFLTRNYNLIIARDKLKKAVKGFIK